MVYYFKSNVVDPPAFVYMGKDKVENEDLIRFGWDEDFHVDNLSSAHVYLRLKVGDDWTTIPKALLEDAAQLTKANSIEGNKKDNVTIIYTPWSNLRKDASMATGQVSFHDQKMVKKVHVAARQNPIVNRLNKTREERTPDLRAEKEADLAQKRKADRLKREDMKARERDEKRRRDQLKWEKEHAYDELMDESNMVSNQDRDPNFYDDDFM
ncbi:Coiled-coil domain-containing protein 25 [Cyphellophora attinorum]|uniref:Coiled-coil domain-containing protein 25 n=1 Tax=Cyphellophora attinorum TaxID=1664694 RepID=A0A0N0NPP9_9EURO|nr:Coiled-coil domain-containing protein 25 [Phialophora attinorum]KPI42799.1 Coiled-coil domain-containing protein 25 [Phialophora attinorum]